MSRATHVLCSWPGGATVRIYGAYESDLAARRALVEYHITTQGYVMCIAYPEGSREPKQGDVCGLEAPTGGRMYGRVIAPQDVAS